MIYYKKLKLHYWNQRGKVFMADVKGQQYVGPPVLKWEPDVGVFTLALPQTLYCF